MSARKVKASLDELLDDGGNVSSTELAAALGITRQAAHERLRREVAAGRLVVEGAARATRYRRTVPRFVYSLRGLAEDRVWDDIRARVAAAAALRGEDQRLADYAFAEMVNNAIDHSGGSKVVITVQSEPARFTFIVEDDGEGAFEHFRRRSRLATPLEALQEISKGKATTDPARHTGEGVFFTSKAAAVFEMHAGELRWIVDNEKCDTAVLSAPARVGTAVTVAIRLPVERTIAAVFAEYTTAELEFNRTRTVVKLFGLGVDFVSRSEARRLLHGLDRFREVIVDFQGVDGVGQGFADEIFRVYATAHPEMRFTPINMNEPVSFMVGRAVRKGSGKQMK